MGYSLEERGDTLVLLVIGKPPLMDVTIMGG